MRYACKKGKGVCGKVDSSSRPQMFTDIFVCKCLAKTLTCNHFERLAAMRIINAYYCVYFLEQKKVLWHRINGFALFAMSLANKKKKGYFLQKRPSLLFGSK